MKGYSDLWLPVGVFVGVLLGAYITVSLTPEPAPCPTCQVQECPQLVYPLEVSELVQTMDGSVAIGEDIDTHVGEDSLVLPEPK